MKRVITGLFGLFFTLGAQAVLLGYEDFTTNDYGSAEIGADSLDGGTGWTDSWTANGNIKYVPTLDLNYSAVGYTDSATKSGSMGTYVIVNVIASRIWSSSAVTSGEVWVSWLSSRPSAGKHQSLPITSGGGRKRARFIQPTLL